MSTSQLSPTLTATSSTSRAKTDIDGLTDLDIAMDGMDGVSIPNIDDLFNFDAYDSNNDAHSQATESPNRTPSPHPAAHSPLAVPYSPTFDFNNSSVDFSSFDFMNEKDDSYNAVAGPSSFPNTFTPIVQPLPVPQPAFVVKEEPVDHWADQPMTGGISVQATAVPVLDASSAVPAVPDFSALPLDQQAALQQFLFNIIAFQAKQPVYNGGMGGMGMVPQSVAIVTPTTVEPSMLFSHGAPDPAGMQQGFNPTQPVAGPSTASTTGNTPGLTVGGSSSSATAPSVAARRVSAAQAEEAEDEEDLISIEPHEQRSARAESSFSYGADEVDPISRLDRLAPLSSIFSAGKGKGGKKGGGLSSVVRQEDEDIDDDDSWRPSPEEYKKLSSKEKRQLRNKLSARAFRNRRKDYIGTLEGHIRERDGVIDDMRAELVTSRSENHDLRKELAALKASTMGILHPASAGTAETPAPAILQSFSLSPNITLPATAGPSQPKKSAPTPVFNPRKDIGIDSKTRWGNENLFGGGSTICHTLLMPDVAAGTAESTPSQASASPFNLPRANINPRIASSVAPPVQVNLQATADGTDLSNASFADWSESNAFSMRSMDSYRMQMWGRLAREAASDKAGLAGAVRPKFLLEPTTPSPEAVSPADIPLPKSTAAHLAAVSAAHITSKLAASFWAAFQSPTSTVDTDKLTAVVTGKARLRIVVNEESEKKQQQAQDEMIAALGGLKLQAGKEAGWREVPSAVGAREDPLRALGGMLGVCRGMGMGIPTRV